MRKALQQLGVFLLLLTLACRQSPVVQEGAVSVLDKADQPTVVYVVRHAEKDTSDVNNQDPGLTEKGMARAELLRKLLQQEPINALYATRYVRTQQTLKPLSEERKLEVLPYEANDFTGLKERILGSHRGQTVVVAGHSNTLLPLLEAFGVKRPVADISEQEYTYLFKLTIAPDGTATLETDHYGVDQ
jgi:2,3-bisphosphoglycerate-dependent phosphoglycerate mutase